MALETAVAIEAAQGLAHLHGGHHRAHCIVIARHGRAKQCHHGVADKLVEHAVVFEDGLHHPSEVVVQHADDLFCRRLLRERREIADVGEKYGHFRPRASQLEFVAVFHDLFGKRPRNVAAERTHQLLFLGDVVGHQHHTQRFILTVAQRHGMDVHVHLIAIAL